MMNLTEHIWTLACVVEKGIRGQQHGVLNLLEPVHPDSMAAIDLLKSEKLLRELADDIVEKRRELTGNYRFGEFARFA
jgi:hypothetical protein